MSVEELLHIQEIARDFYDHTIVLEIGSFLGRSAVEWALSKDGIEVTCCDPWMGRLQDFNFEFLKHSLNGDLDSLKPEDYIYAHFLDNTYGCYNIRHIRCYSEELKDLYVYEHPDIIFIDGDHSVEGLTKDLNLALELGHEYTKICGHDYNHPHGDLFHVKTTVDDWAAANGFAVHNHVGTIFQLEKL
jgi:hypothetical protein